MFSGIIEELGLAGGIQRRGNIFLLKVKAKKVLDDVKVGDSVAVNGVCLTAVAIDRNSITFQLLAETMQKTNLGSLHSAEKVNLERSLKVGDRISGHFVMGHVECTGLVRRRYQRIGNTCFDVVVPLSFMSYVIPKGSIALDGISLTVAGKRSNTFSVYVIPHTLTHTTLGFKSPSHKVNVEFDILAKQNLPRA
ncbi:MAG: riboflavin synthase [Candidatus Omnitrophota bacterium]|jgi:riboflavin synthase|nr:MAG: riboflavin synthase [Candidatus Omnitrophota bacterium]